MGSPLVLLIIWFLINAFLNSSKDKKKIEEARRKRLKQLGERKPVLTKTVTHVEDEQYQAEMGSARIEQTEDITHDIYDIQTPKVTAIIKTEEKEKSKEKNSAMDIKSDIVKGIIFSEILSEPKSIQNMKRGM